ncbi:NF038104 family lipoprotein [Acinetobacter sp. MB5]|uniref:NF038104 family lipoprotein n=1 Tax=Acinetobacter sp. MB5 TaxID=2069438 RepID=UPI000DD0DE5B|nr:NF038104 family lipoprotein [Acinetobacter sp. MB5]
MKRLCIILATVVLLQGCITSLVTVPVKIAYEATKGVVKGTAAVVRAVTPDKDDDKDKNKTNDQEKQKDQEKD